VTGGSTQGPENPSPGDVPAERPAALRGLDALVGAWEMQALFPGNPPLAGGGLTTFEWLDGRRFLIQRVTAAQPDGPAVIAIIGAEPDGSLAQHYFDNRGVHRVYQMTLDSGSWKLWRESPGFWQRYTGTLSPDGATIKGAWEKSPDGSRWEHDFGLVYTKVRWGRELRLH
jgi:hypothetical protein